LFSAAQIERLCIYQIPLCAQHGEEAKTKNELTIQQLNDELTKLRQLVDDARAQSAANEENGQVELETLVAMLRQQLQDCETKLKDSETRLHDKEQELWDVQGQVDEAVRARDRLQTQINVSIQERDTALSEVQKKVKEVEDLDQQLKLLKLTMNEPQSIGGGDVNDAQVGSLHSNF
jgi:chromosome segregation ATPase